MAKKNRENLEESLMGELKNSAFSRRSQQSPANNNVSTESTPDLQLEKNPQESETKESPSKTTSKSQKASTTNPKSINRVTKGFHITEEQSKKLDRVEKKVSSKMKNAPVGRAMGRSAIVRHLIETMDESSDEFIEKVQESIIEEVMAKYR